MEDEVIQTNSAITRGMLETKHTDHKRLLKKLHRMNQRTERSRVALKDQFERRVAVLQQQIEQLTRQIAALSTTDPKVAHRRQVLQRERAQLQQELGTVQMSLSPTYQTQQILQQMHQAKTELKEAYEAQTQKFRETAKSVLRKNVAISDGVYRHEKKWNPDSSVTKDYISRRGERLGPSDPQKIKDAQLSWTRFNFKYPEGKPKFTLKSGSIPTLIQSSSPSPSGMKDTQRNYSSKSNATISSNDIEDDDTAPWRVAHPKQWTLGVSTGQRGKLFSTFERDAPSSTNEARVAQRAIYPDRISYNPMKDGKRPWINPKVDSLGPKQFTRFETEAQFLAQKEDNDRFQRWERLGFDPQESEPSSFLISTRPSSKLPLVADYSMTSPIQNTFTSLQVPSKQDEFGRKRSDSPNSSGFRTSRSRRSHNGSVARKSTMSSTTYISANRRKQAEYQKRMHKVLSTFGSIAVRDELDDDLDE